MHSLCHWVLALWSILAANLDMFLNFFSWEILNCLMFFYCDGQLTRNVLTLYLSLKGSFLRYFGRILGCVPVFFENSPMPFFIDILDYILMATRLQKLVRFCRMGPFYIYFLIFLELFNIFNDILHIDILALLWQQQYFWAHFTIF